MPEVSRRDFLHSSAGGVLAAASPALRARAAPPAAAGDLAWMPATALAAAIRAKKISPVEIVDAVYARIRDLNPRLNAYCTLMEEDARRAARQAEDAVMRGDRLG